MNTVNRKGMSLVEILIVIAVFAILAIIATSSVILTLRGARKSEAQIKVRENVNYALAVVERQIRNSQEVEPCPNPSSSVLNYVSKEDISTSFSCQSIGVNGYIASGSARLTSTDISITGCSLSCSLSSGLVPIVNVSVTAQDVASTAVEGSVVTSETEIVLRNY